MYIFIKDTMYPQYMYIYIYMCVYIYIYSLDSWMRQSLRT